MMLVLSYILILLSQNIQSKTVETLSKICYVTCTWLHIDKHSLKNVLNSSIDIA